MEQHPSKTSVWHGFSFTIIYSKLWLFFFSSHVRLWIFIQQFHLLQRIIGHQHPHWNKRITITRHPRGLYSPPIFHMDSTGLQSTFFTAKLYLDCLWLKWTGVHWSPLDWTIQLESIWTLTTGKSYQSGLESTGVHWSPLGLNSEWNLTISKQNQICM